MTIASVFTRIFSPATYTARKAVAHEQVFKKALGDLLDNVGNLQRKAQHTNVGLCSNEAHIALSILKDSSGAALDLSNAKLQLRYVKVLKKDFESQLKDVLKVNGQRDCWRADHLKPLNALYRDANKLQHFNHRDYGQQKSQQQ
ncbi:hypothetical protein [Stenotrophomonas sp.]|uniref:hypothetical protein n=1 Tax=Stenotrophomonas sp. TaxID=69392 RepID=UPI0028AD723C|nr:hypothetical protein [Stenotrophomonas sp.]